MPSKRLTPGDCSPRLQDPDAGARTAKRRGQGLRGSAPRGDGRPRTGKRCPEDVSKYLWCTTRLESPRGLPQLRSVWGHENACSSPSCCILALATASVRASKRLPFRGTDRRVRKFPPYFSFLRCGNYCIPEVFKGWSQAMPLTVSVTQMVKYRGQRRCLRKHSGFAYFEFWIGFFPLSLSSCILPAFRSKTYVQFIKIKFQCARSTRK